MSTLPQKRTYAIYSINLSARATIACGRARSRDFAILDDQFVFRWRMNRKVRLLPFENAIEVASNNPYHYSLAFSAVYALWVASRPSSSAQAVSINQSKR